MSEEITETEIDPSLAGETAKAEESLSLEVQAQSALRDLSRALKLYAANSSHLFIEDLDPELFSNLGFLADLPKSAARVSPQQRRPQSAETHNQTQNSSQRPNQPTGQAPAQAARAAQAANLQPQAVDPQSTNHQTTNQPATNQQPANPTVTLRDTLPQAQPEREQKTLDPLAAQSLDSLHLRIKNCLDCNLGHSRVNLVFGQGNQEADLLFIGEAPTEEEDRSGNIYNSPAGKLLTQIITSIGVSRESVYFCNTLKCKVPVGQKPTKDEIQACSGILGKQIALLKPKLIVTLGNVATKALLPDADAISKIRGSVQNYQGIPVIPTFHPRYLLKTHSHLTQMWDDMRVVRQKLFMS